MKCLPTFLFRAAGLLLLVLSISCQREGREEARIPPEYTKELKKRREADLIAYLSNCIRRRVDVAGSYYKRSQVYFDQGEYKKALEDIDEAIANKDNVGEYYLQRGLVNRELNLLDDALRDAQRAEALQQKAPELYVLMADVLQEQRKFAEANRYIEGIMQITPYDGAVYYVKGMLQSKTGDTLASIASLEKAIAMNPKLMRAYKEATALYYRTGDYANSRRISDIALTYFPENIELLMEKASLYAAQSQSDSAVLYYRKALKVEPQYKPAMIKMADLFIKVRNYEAALGTYERIRRLTPDYPSIDFLIGFCYEKMWRFSEARAYYEQELERTPGSPQARYGLWRITQQLNKKDETTEEPVEGTPQKTLDDSRIRITPIQPRAIPR